MNAMRTLLTGLGLGAGLMYILDPDQGRRRRAMVRDQANRLTNEVQEGVEVVRRDMNNRLEGLRHGDWTVLVGGRRSLQSGLRGRWSPSGRTILGVVGTGLFLYGLTQRAPKACFLGTIGLAVAAEGITNASIDEIRQASERVYEAGSQAYSTASTLADHLNRGLQGDGREHRQTQATGKEG